jgi:hypothetical protein
MQGMMKMIKGTKLSIGCVVLMSLSACGNSLRSGDSNWAVRVEQSYVYSNHSASLGIYFDEDKPQVLLGGNLRRTLEELRWDIRIPKYNGVGTLFGEFLYESVSSPITLNPFIPDAIITDWVNNYDSSKFYTYFSIPEKGRQLMATPQKVINARSKEEVCYQNAITYVFYPTGDGRAWISGCGKYTYVGEVKSGLPPEKVKKIIKNIIPDYFENSDDKYAIYNDPTIAVIAKKQAKERASEVGLKSLLPLPLDEINTLYTPTTCEGIKRFVFTEPLGKLDIKELQKLIFNENDFGKSFRRCKKQGEYNITEPLVLN